MKEKVFNYLKENYRELVIISCITLLALMLRLVMLSNYGELWLDELYSWYFGTQSNVFKTIFEVLRQDIHMPFYFVLLHIWTKIFGDSDTSMHLCTLTMSIPLIPLSYYAMKDLFGKMVGYFASIMFAINTFCMYYSLEVRFYGLVIVLSLLSAYYFVKMLENFDKKYTLGFIISQCLLLYTFSITPLLTICYAIVGLVYLKQKNAENLKNFVSVLIKILLIALPVIIFAIYNFIVMHTTFCSFAKDIYVFSPNVICDILENFFSSENYQLLTGQINAYGNIFGKLESGKYFFFVFIPVVIGLFGFIRAICCKSEKLYLFLFPSLMFFFIFFTLGAFEVTSFLTKYNSIIYPVIVCSACFGLSKLWKNYISIIVLVVFVILNYSYLYVTPYNLLALNRQGISSITEVMNNIVKVKDDDYILIPYSGSKVMKYIPRGQYIPFCADDGLLLKDTKSQDFYFDRVFKDHLNRKNLKSEFRYYVTSDSPFTPYELTLSEFYFKKMHKGQRFILVSFRDNFTMPLIQNWKEVSKTEVYENMNLFSLFMAKITKDSFDVADKYLKQDGYYINQEQGYSIFVFKKQ